MAVGSTWPKPSSASSSASASIAGFPRARSWSEKAARGFISTISSKSAPTGSSPPQTPGSSRRGCIHHLKVDRPLAKRGSAHRRPARCARYILASLIETTISRDVPLLARIDKPVRICLPASWRVLLRRGLAGGCASRWRTWLGGRFPRPGIAGGGGALAKGLGSGLAFVHAHL